MPGDDGLEAFLPEPGGDLFGPCSILFGPDADAIQDLAARPVLEHERGEAALAQFRHQLLGLRLAGECAELGAAVAAGCAGSGRGAGCFAVTRGGGGGGAGDTSVFEGASVAGAVFTGAVFAGAG
jgi:hypothetical protein